LWNEHDFDISHLESLPFYEYQVFIEKLNSKIEEENKKNSSEGMVEAFSLGKGQNNSVYGK
jgi:hypothetical protein